MDGEAARLVLAVCGEGAVACAGVAAVGGRLLAAS
jgi:hypothetical protein